MDRCKHYKELILTDYADGVLDATLKKELATHLAKCRACRDFAKDVQQEALEPFSRAAREAVPANLWDTIRRTIEDDHAPAAWWETVIMRLRNAMKIPVLAPAFGSLAALIVAGIVVFSLVYGRYARDREQSEYLVSLIDKGNGLATISEDAASTPLEDFFL